jgi:hypothetical protein
VTGSVLGLATATAAVVARRRTQPSLEQQAAEVRKRYHREAATLRAEGAQMDDLRRLQSRAMNELNKLRVRYLESLDGGWRELSVLDKFRISVEFGVADPATVRVEKEPGTLTLTKTNEGRVREQVKRMLDKGNADARTE